MKIKLYFDKGNLGRLAVAMIFAAVLFWKIGFSVWALPVFGACYFLFKSLEVELSEKIPWVWTDDRRQQYFHGVSCAVSAAGCRASRQDHTAEDAAQYLVLSGGISGGTGFYQ